MTESESPSHVLLAMSGGMDSSIAAAILMEKGWKVRGLHFLLPADRLIRKQRLESTIRVSRYLDLPLEVMDLEKEFSELVIDPFVMSYLKGLTPNPCVACNELVKFSFLLSSASERGYGNIATGHYARLKKTDDGVELLRGKDRSKDQSYFLHRLDQNCLEKAVFPLGNMLKEEAKALAAAMSLPVGTSRESQEICFLSQRDYRPFVEKWSAFLIETRGDIVDEKGEVLGGHAGAHRYTIGQRKGLGIASERPYYVKEIRPSENKVVVARREDLYSTEVTAEGFRWIIREPHDRMMAASAQIRYRHPAAPGRLEILSSDRVRFTFESPQWAVTPGQALVCYRDDKALGGGWIVRNS